MQGGPVRQVKLTNSYQSMSKIPLMIAMDAEWGPAMRLDSVISFQRQLTWGAMTHDSTVYEVGTIIAQQLKRLGVNITLHRISILIIIIKIRLLATELLEKINIMLRLKD